MENPNPVVMALAIRDKGTCEVLLPKDRYDPLAVLAMMEGWQGHDAEPDCLWWRVAIEERARPARGPWISGRLRVVRLRP